MDRDTSPETVIKTLQYLFSHQKQMWLTYFLGIPIFPGTKRVYMTKAAARAALNSLLIRYNVKYADEIKASIDKLIELKIIEIRTALDRSPGFPYNIEGVDKEQGDKFMDMLRSSDEELTVLAVEILKSLLKIKGNDRENNDNVE